MEHLKDEGLEKGVGNESLGKGLHLRGAERVFGPGSSVREVFQGGNSQLCQLMLLSLVSEMRSTDCSLLYHCILSRVSSIVCFSLSAFLKFMPVDTNNPEVPTDIFICFCHYHKIAEIINLQRRKFFFSFL